VNSIHRVSIPWPVESLQEIEDDNLPSNLLIPGWFKVCSPTADEWRTFFSATRTGLVTYNNELREESLSPGRNHASPADNIHTTRGRATKLVRTPKRYLRGIASPTLDHCVLAPPALNPFRGFPTTPVSIGSHSHSPLPMIRSGVPVGGENVNCPSTGQFDLYPFPNHSTVHSVLSSIPHCNSSPPFVTNATRSGYSMHDHTPFRF